MGRSQRDSRRDDRPQAGFALIEVLVTAVVTGIAVSGVAMMLATASGWVAAGGDDRIALKLAQQKIEQLRGLAFSCVATGGPGAVLTPTSPCTVVQDYSEGPGNTWVTGTGAAAAQPAPTTHTFTRMTCVQFVADGATTGQLADTSLPPYLGGTNPTTTTCLPYVNTTVNPATSCAATSSSCKVTNIKRITVVVQPSRTTASVPPVVLQAWITAVPGGI